jgi:hypothetical protein
MAPAPATSPAPNRDRQTATATAPPTDSVPAGLTPTRRAWLPTPWLPLAYFAGAHLALAVGLLVLAVAPATAGPHHLHPRMLALVHLLTLGWISGSILGALYIVAPLALGLPLPARWTDRVACAAYWVGVAGMVGGFWQGRFDAVGHASLLVLIPIVCVGSRVTWGLRRARLPAAVTTHVVLAFANIVAAGAFGFVLAANRVHGWFEVSPLALAAAHAHVAVIGWAAMLIVGLSYRLIPMFLPAAMPTTPHLVWSAVLLEAGALGLAWAFVSDTSPWLWIGCVVAAFGWFSQQIRGVLRHRRPRPAEMHGRDWSTWQTHAALLYAAVAVGAGLWLQRADASPAWTWVYGVTGLLGFVAQMVVGIQGRLLPMHAWYCAMRRLDGLPPGRSAHTLAEPRLTLPIFLLWLGGVPMLAAGLGWQLEGATSAGAAALTVAVMLQAAHVAVMMRRALTRLAD